MGIWQAIRIKYNGVMSVEMDGVVVGNDVEAAGVVVKEEVAEEEEEDREEV